jgi:hypothetical protein
MRFGKRIAKRPNSLEDRELRAKIVEFLNERIRGNDRLAAVYRRGITAKWLSWSKNRAGIEQSVKKESHA